MAGRMKRFILALLACCGMAAPAFAQPPPFSPELATIMNDVRINDWSDAGRLAAQQPDRLVGKLVRYFRLLDPGAASAGEIAAFIAANRDWPAQPALIRAANAAIVAETDDGAARADCRVAAIVTAAAAARCAQAFAGVNPKLAGDFARRAWISGFDDPSEAAGFQARWQPQLTPDADWRRFGRLALAGKAAPAATTLPLLAPDRQAIGQAWLALAKGTANAPALFAALPPRAQATPFLFLAELAAQPDPEGKYALWQSLGTMAEGQAKGLARALFWPHREALARILLQQKHPRQAYALVVAAMPESEVQKASRSFLAGFIALRFLHDPTLAHPWFAGLADLSTAVITRARAYYWLAQTESGAQAEADLNRAAAYPDTFYGQLASVQLGDTPARLAARIRDLPPPPVSPAMGIDFAERELPQAAVLLSEMGAPRRAKAFLLRAAEILPNPGDRLLAARLADGIGLPSTAVMIARLAGSDGTMLVNLGWPLAIDPPVSAAGPDIVLSIIRQESSFDPNAVSPSGAQGLMQLMPRTAREIAAKSGLANPRTVQFASPPLNLQLGSAYFASLMNRFGECMPLAIAAYNGGPRNVENWIAENGDPRLPGVSIIDWIEEIPFAETRNYVQRVTEGVVIYRALRTGRAADPLARWLKAEGLKSGG